MAARQNGGGGVNRARALFNEWLSDNYGYIGFELHYRDIPPRIVAEKCIGELDENPTDYKFHCFNGKVEYIQFITDRNLETHYAREIFYDRNWEEAPFISGVRPRREATQKPANLDEMLRFAEALSGGFAYVRVDFYDIAGKIYFGEMTFTSDNGMAKWDPPETNIMLGEKIKLPKPYLLPSEKEVRKAAKDAARS